jgi:hypothetical protein
MVGVPANHSYTGEKSDKQIATLRDCNLFSPIISKPKHLTMEKELLTNLALNGWNSHIIRIDALLGKLSDEQLNNEVSPGKNRGIYLLGHLASVHDMMLPLLGLGDSLNTAYHTPFVSKPDKEVKDLPSVAEVRAYWNKVNAELANQFAALKPDEWFARHTAVSEEDFKKEPHRNRLSVLLSRTTHMAYHFGQLALLQPKAQA